MRYELERLAGAASGSRGPTGTGFGGEALNTSARRITSIMVLALAAFLWACPSLFAAAPKITEESLRTVHAAYLEARRQGFTPEAMAKLYSTPDVPNVASVVKKLVDLHQSRPELAIPPADSLAMEKTRQAMNMRVLCELAAVTGGSVEAMNAGKQNGIRSDKDLMVFGVLDGKRYVSATEIKALYEKHFKEIHGIDLEKMDMTIFDGDAMIPDWRKTNMSFDEFVEKYKKGQAKLEQNPEAVREAGTWRQGAELRYATNSRVTLVRPAPEGGEPGRSAATEFEVREVDLRAKAGDPSLKMRFAVIEEVHVKEASARYASWSKDLPYRNAMDASFEWWQRFEHTQDFVDRMKYFNRTVGDGANALATQGWDVQYIFHLAKLEARARAQGGANTREHVDAFIHRMAQQVYAADCSPDMVQHFERVITIATYIELDKMSGQSKGEAHYLAPLIADARKEHKAKTGQELRDSEALAKARDRFYDHQRQIMRYNLMLTARHKLRMDLGDTERLKRLRAKYTDPAAGHDGEEEVKKLTWETWRQVGRIIEQLDDDALVRKLISDAPENLRPKLENLHELARIKRVEAEQARKIALERSDPRKAAETGAEEKTLAKAAAAQLEERQTRLQKVLDRIGAPLDEFKARARAGEYSDEAITARLHERMLDTLGFEERATFHKMQVEFETKFRASHLLKNVVSLGNVNSLLNVLLVYQETGDLQQVAQTAVWEIVSNLPYVTELATLRQSFNDGNYEGLTFLFIAWQIPAAGHVKLVFDVAKGTLTLVYNHAMDPLKDDRFSQLYLGYVDEQPPGWSPLKPGWKERRDAANLSILHFVPGETFDEKRTNMFKYFNDKLDARLRANGIEPTTEKYWQTYDDIIEPFFGAYVMDYFKAQGEWKDNVTVGLHAVGQQEEMKRRLLQQLVRDFRQGQRNYDKMQLARAKMEEATAQMDALGKKGVALERNRLLAVDAVGDDVAKALASALPKTEALKPAGKAILKVDVGPAIVQEEQEATITARVIRVDATASGEPPIIEVKRAGSAALDGDPRILSRDEVAKAKSLEEDLCFLKALLDDPEAPKKRFHASSIDYEVTAKTRDGQVIAREKVRVNLVGAAKHTGEDVQVKLLKVAPGKAFADPLLNAFVEYDGALVTPFNCVSENLALTGLHPMGLSLWVRWKDALTDKPTYAEMRITGGAPPVDKLRGDWVQGMTAFAGTEKEPPQFGGNCYRLSPEFPRSSVGRFQVRGKLLVYDREESVEAKRKEMKPLKEFPFEAEFEVPDPPRPAKGSLALDAYNTVKSGKITVENCQNGKRPARFTFGGRTRWFWLESYDGKGALVPSDLRNCMNASSGALFFQDYGRNVSVDVPLEIKKDTGAPEPFPQERVDRFRAEMSECLKNEGTYLLKISAYYADIAQTLRNSGWSMREFGPWKEARQKRIEYLKRAIAAMGNPAWPGFNASGQYINTRTAEGRSISRPAEDDAAGRAAYAQGAVRYYTAELRDVLRDAIAEAFDGDDLGLAAGWAAELEKAAAAVPGKDSSAAVAQAYTRLAGLTFALTGDLDAARAHYVKAMTVAAAANGRTYEPQMTPFDRDKEFK